MNPVRVTFARARKLYRNRLSTASAVAAFLSAVAVLLTGFLETRVGDGLSLAQIWTLSASFALPYLAALVGMNGWSDERQSGRLELLLSAPVRERDLVLGKFLGLWSVLLFATLLSLVANHLLLVLLSPTACAGVTLFTYLPGLFALALQSALWSALVLASSAVLRRGAAAFVLTVLLASVLPRAVWYVFQRFLPGHLGVGEMPLDAQAIDFASGLFNTAPIALCALGTLFFLCWNSKTILLARLGGRSGRARRLATHGTVLLAAAVTVLAVALAYRLDTTLDLQVGRGEMRFSDRTRDILGESSGTITVTAFLPRDDARFRPVTHFLRALKGEADGCFGVRLVLKTVDPRWDVAAAARLVQRGVPVESLVFERNRRFVALPLADGWGERLAASAIQNLTQPAAHRLVLWTRGHGEPDFNDYGPFGLSDIARELSRDGYRNAPLDLTTTRPDPDTCALVVVAGARDEFSRAEVETLRAYLRQSGRLLVLLNGTGEGGLSALLPEWGLSLREPVAGKGRTRSGSDLVVTDFGSHPLAAPLKGSQLVLDRPVTFTPSAAATLGGGVDCLQFTPLATAGGQVVAAVVERGAGAGHDTTLRPTRLVAVGDAVFALNASLASRANANRDFFLNCAAYLAGRATLTAGGAEADVLTTGFDARECLVFLGWSALAVPASVLFLGFLFVLGRRLRS